MNRPSEDSEAHVPIARPEFGPSELEAVNRVISSGNVVQGSEVAAFEAEFSREAVDGALAVAVNSGTSALHLINLALGLGPGDEVVLPSFTFAASPNSIAITGARPVFVDIDPLTFTLDVDAVRSAITPRTRAILAVHLYGQPSDVSALLALSEESGVHLLEDAAQAHLAAHDGRRVGSWGLAAAFSFYPTKNMTSGEGGMVTTRDATVARTVRLLRNQGQEIRYKNEIVGLNNRMTDIHAAIGRTQLSALQDRTSRRQFNASFYDTNLRNVVTPYVRPGSTHVYHQYTIRVPGHDRDRVADELQKRGIGTGVYYPTPCHCLPPYEGAQSLDLTHTDAAAREVLSLPVHPTLKIDELERVVSAVNDVSAAGS